MERPAWNKMSKRARGEILVALLVLVLVGVGIIGSTTSLLNLPKLHLPEGLSIAAEEPVADEEQAEPEVEHLPLPDEVRAIYWTAHTGGSHRGQQLLEYMKATGLNAVVLDLKMDNGQIAFTTHDESMHKYVMTNPVMENVDALVQQLHDEGIYVIARVAVMRDGAMAVQNPDVALRWPGGSMWVDNTGARWVDPASTKVSDYAVALGREAYARGFDEIQYDYVRFASDGRISAIQYPVYDFTKTKIEVMQEFFKNVGGVLKEEGIPVSFDVFGMTFENTHDFNIGQRLLDVWPHADFVSPMQYPSHYADGFDGFANPALHPYPIVKNGLDRGAAMLERELGIFEETSRPTFRPWLQDFDIGAVYTAARIEAQIQAARDAGASGWMLWNARNVYEPANYLPKTPEETQ